MTKEKLTPWFPLDVKPARVGIYQRDFNDGTEAYQLWDGRQWLYGSETVEETARKAASDARRAIIQHRPWRGLAKDPS